MTHVSVVTPAFNDEKTAPTVLGELVRLLQKEKWTYEIVIIDDQSRDSTPELLRRFARHSPNVRVFFHKKNQGIAKTYRELYVRARYPIIASFSLDGEWEPADLIRLVKKLEEDRFDMVIGWRTHKEYLWGRKVVSALYNFLILLLFGVKSYDAGSIKVMRKEVIERIPIISHGIFDEAERIIRASSIGYRIGVVPVTHKRVAHKRRFLPRVGLMRQTGVDLFRVWWSMRG